MARPLFFALNLSRSLFRRSLAVPIYEYKCEQCDHQLEILQKISADPVKTCPDCGQEGLRKLISAVAFRLKGGGWYETDFKDKPPKQAAKAEGEGKTGPEKTEKSTDGADKPASTDKPAKGKGKAEKTPAAGSGV